MKGILEFNLPEDADEFRIASNARLYLATLLDIFEHLRSLEKHTDAETVDIAKLRSELWQNVPDEILQDL